MTTDMQVEQGWDSMPEEFIEQVKDALEHLYDLPHLQRHPLAQKYVSTIDTKIKFAGQGLRRELVAAIEALNPGQNVPFRAPHARLYHALTLHYMERTTIQETAYQLGISPRQALRNLRQGERSVAKLLWDRHGTQSAQEPSAQQISSFKAEIDHLDSPSRSTDVSLLLEQAKAAVEPLAAQQDVTLSVDMPQGPVMLSTNPVMAQQVLVSALSHAVQLARAGTLHLALSINGEDALLVLRYSPSNVESTTTSVLSPVAARLADQLGWIITAEDQPEGNHNIVFRMAIGRPTVLIVDDNEGLVVLLQRYLTDQACRVVAAQDGQEGLRLARELLPDAIVLDVMMPEMQGWEVLQRLKSDPQTINIPVIVCSVIVDPRLAQALGASAFVPKPVRRQDILIALRQLGVV